MVLSAVAVIVGVVAAAYFSVDACVSTTRAGSAREVACDVPQVGAWIYPLLVGVTTWGGVARMLATVSLPSRSVVAWVLLPTILTLLVPVVLHLLPGH